MHRRTSSWQSSASRTTLKTQVIKVVETLTPGILTLYLLVGLESRQNAPTPIVPFSPHIRREGSHSGTH